jgi:hypothetical protein
VVVDGGECVVFDHGLYSNILRSVRSSRAVNSGPSEVLEQCLCGCGWRFVRSL